MESLGRRRSDRWLLRPDAVVWHYRGIAVLMLAGSAVCAVVVVHSRGHVMVAAHMVGTILGIGSVTVVLTHHIVSRFNASADAYFLGFQAGLEAGQSGKVDPGEIRRRVRHQADTRLRSIDGCDPSSS